MTILATILAGTLAASTYINPAPTVTPAPLEHIAQGWGYGPRYFPRRNPWPPEDAPYDIPRADPSPFYRGPMERDLDRYYRRRRFQQVQPMHPW
jgi:hypothetical protein